MKYIVISTLILASIIILNVNLVYSENLEPTILKLHKMRSSIVDGGQPLVFVGKLISATNEPIHNATIFIKNNQDCPANQIVGQATTDKTGKFYVYTISKIWNEKENRITFHAEFLGDEKYSPSVSEKRTFVIYPTFAEKCEE